MASRTSGDGPNGLLLTLKSSTSSGFRPRCSSSAKSSAPCSTGSMDKQQTPQRKGQGGECYRPAQEQTGAGQVGNRCAAQSLAERIMTNLFEFHAQHASR